MNTVAVIIPTHTARNVNGMLQRAVNSVVAQTRQPDQWSISHDSTCEGSAATRNHALMAVTAKWSAFLDSDDEWLPEHLQTLMGAALMGDADVVYSGCRVLDAYGREIPRHDDWGWFGHEFSADRLRERSYIPVTSLVNTKLAQRVGGFEAPYGTDYDDWGFYLKMLNAGARFLHVPKVTWIWHHHGMNTSGRPDQGDGGPQ